MVRLESRPLSMRHQEKTTQAANRAPTQKVFNGADDIWWIDEGQDYHRLRWELDE
jgi:hypothetical protein